MGYYSGWYCNTTGTYDFKVSKNHKVWTTFQINSNPWETQKYISKVSLSNGYNLESNTLEKCYVCIFDQEFSGTSFNEDNTYDGLISFTLMNISDNSGPYSSGYIYNFLIDNLRLYNSEKTYYLYYLADENEDEDNKLIFKSGEFYDYFIPSLTLEKSDYYIITFKSEENEITDIYFSPGNYTIPTISVLKTGHELVGWKTNEPNSSLVKAGDSIQPSSNLTYIAEWTPIAYNLTINPAGGRMAQARLNNGTNTDTVTSFTVKFLYNNYRHLGTTENERNFVIFSDTVGRPSNKTTNGSITHTFNGWEITSGGGSVEFYTKENLDTAPAGYSTDNFNEELRKPASSSYYIYNGQYAGDTTITAQWQVVEGAMFIITFDANGGEFKPNSFIGGSNTPQLEPRYGTTNYYKWEALAEASRPGYTLTGYFDSKTGGNSIYYKTGECEYNSSYWNTYGQWQYDNNITAYAQWTPNEYAVTFDANGGRIIDDSNTNLSTWTIGVVYDSLYGELPEVERSGYEFLGWFDAENGGNKIDENSLVKIADDHTIYAQWKSLSIPDSPCFVYSEENGEKKWIQITPYYYNGSNWEQVIPYYYNGTNWQQL